MLSGTQLSGINVVLTGAAIAASTTGNGITFRQCNGYKLYNASTNNFQNGIVIEGGQLGSLKSFQAFATSGSLIGGSSLLKFATAPYGAGLRQKCYTVQVEDFRMSATNLRTSCIRIENADGINFTNGYVGFGANNLVRLINTHDDSYIAAVAFANVYFDCVGTGNTPTAFELPQDVFSNTYVYGLTIGSGCVLGNGDNYGVLCAKAETMLLSIVGATFLNFKKHAVNFNTAGSTTLTNLQINGCQVQNCGSDGTGSIIRAAGGRLVSIVGNTFSDCGSSTNILSLSGTWGQGTVSANVNGSAVADFGNTATFTNGYAQSGNSSVWTKGGATSWVGEIYTGIGGTVTQGAGSGKATAVTLDKLEGLITTDAASLSAGATVSFTLNNSKIRADDIVLAQRQSGGTGTSYRVWCDFVSAGNCGICIQNITGGALAEALAIQFKVIRSSKT
jgi:hypothetical protein